MKSQILRLIVGASIAASFSLHAAPVLVTNGDFESGAASWGEAGAPNTTFSYPTSGGNPNGYGVMTNTGGGFGVFIADNGEIPLANLGLTAGESYTFFQDLLLISGPKIGGLKVEFYKGGNPAAFSVTPEMFIPLMGTIGTWEKHTYNVPIPSDAETLKIVPLWGANSSVGYDNVGVDDSPLPPGPPIPNPDFEIPNGADWHFFEAGGHSVTYPASGGNPGGFAQISATTAGGYAGITPNNDAPISLDALGLTAGETYTFSVDMKIISGDNIGKFKVDFKPEGSTSEIPTTKIGDGTTWAKYQYDIAIPTGTTSIVIVPLWGVESVVGFDNIAVNVPFVAPFTADIQTGTILTWGSEGPTVDYQPQGSFNEFDWDNIGPLIIGTTSDSAFTADPYPFYRVLLTQDTVTDAALNGDFELDDGGTCAQNWLCRGSQLPTRITSDFRNGTACIRLAVDNSSMPTPNDSEIQQNITNEGGSVVPGQSYDFSFWAKQISSGVSYVQRYKVDWLDGVGAILGGGVGFLDFSGGAGTWKEITASGLVAPEGAATALIQIFGTTGAVADPGAIGEVLIDDLSLSTSETIDFDTLEAETAPGIGVSWPTIANKIYQVKSSTDLINFTDFGTPITGDNTQKTAVDSITPLMKYYKVVESE
jgi:hypothetical protein